MKKHHYKIKIKWTGNLGKGTENYRSYSRNHEIQSEGKSVIYGSSDPSFRGDHTRYNPEELFVSSLSQCHMLWFLHLCSEAGVTVIEYFDEATGTMEENPDGSGHFTEVTLYPQVIIAGEVDPQKFQALHEQAHHYCFIANSCNFPVLCKASVGRRAQGIEHRA